MTSLRKKVFEYIKKKYQVSPEYPWKRDETSAVFRHSDNNNKWFALCMKVSRDKLGLGSYEDTDVLNLKMDDLILREILIREGGVYPAYHMSKMHWITVILDGSVPEDKVFDLVDSSFMATASAKKKEKIRPPKEWIIPSNPKYYDVIQAFEDAEEIDWKQGRGIKTGDTVFLYVGAPVSAILYKCQVTETDIPYDFRNKNLTIKALMKIRLLKRYDPGEFTFDVLKSKYNIFAVRGPRGIPNSLSAALNKGK